MITKITPGLTRIVKQPVRANLQKVAVAGLAVLAGSSMSNWHGPRFEPTEMIIPGGLDFKEKAYFLLKGKLPKSVYERWVPQSDSYAASQGDQVVTVNIADGQYIGDIVEAPHEIGTIAPHGDIVAYEQDVLSSIGGTEVAGTDGDDTELSAFEIWKHLAGFPD